MSSISVWKDKADLSKFSQQSPHLCLVVKLPPSAGLFDQVKAAAASAATTATNVATQAANTTSNLATQAYNSQAAASVAETTKSLGAQALNTAGVVAGQVQQQAHAVAPSVIPAPATTTAGVDSSSDLEPQSGSDRAKLDKLFSARPDPADLQEKGILKGEKFDG